MRRPSVYAITTADFVVRTGVLTVAAPTSAVTVGDTGTFRVTPHCRCNLRFGSLPSGCDGMRSSLEAVHDSGVKSMANTTLTVAAAMTRATRIARQRLWIVSSGLRPGRSAR